MAIDQRLRLNSVLGSFQVKRLIGKGGMGEVYEAYEPILERKVALKIIGKDAAADSFILKSFRNEGKALAQINHPYVVSIFSFGEDQGVEYIAMEYVEGENLKEKIRKKEFDLRQSIFIFKQVLSGIKALHENNIIHRDIKPPNIILQDNGKPKIVDFGIAKRVKEDTITQTGTGTIGGVVGSIYYLSPELLNGRKATVQADIWSLGVIFYEMLTFIRPFRGKNQEAIMDAVLNNPIEFSPYVKSILPRAVQAIIKKMCAKDPELRYLSIDEVEGDLIRWEKEDPNFNIKMDNDPDMYEDLEKTSHREPPTSTQHTSHTRSQTNSQSRSRTQTLTNISAEDRLRDKRKKTSIRRKRKKKRKKKKSNDNILGNAIAVAFVLAGGWFIYQGIAKRASGLFQNLMTKVPSILEEDQQEPIQRIETPLPKDRENYVDTPQNNNRIVLEDDGQERQVSNVVSPILKKSPQLFLPKPGFTTSSSQNPSIKFQWEPLPEATSYLFQMSTDPSFDKVFYETRTQAPEELINFELPTAHFYWRVKGENEFSKGIWSKNRQLRVNP